MKKRCITLSILAALALAAPVVISLSEAPQPNVNASVIKVDGEPAEFAFFLPPDVGRTRP